MGVIWNDPETGEGDFTRTSSYTEGWLQRGAREQGCSYCHEPIRFPCLYWMADKDIFLHPECLAPLATRLFRDLHEYDCAARIEGGRPMRQAAGGNSAGR